MQENESRVNRAVEMYRYLFAFAVFVLHFRPYGNFAGEHGQFNGGYLAVEFYFVLSGFLMARGMERRQGSPERSALKYLASRLKRILPQYWFALAVLLAVNALLWTDRSAAGMLDYPVNAISHSFPDVLTLQIFHRPAHIDYYTWYVSALLWGSVIVYYLRARLGRWFTRAAAPVIMAYGIWRFSFFVGNVDISAGWEGLLRAVMEISLGCLAWGVYRRLEPLRGRINAAAMTVAEIVLLTGIFAVMYFVRRAWWDCLMMFPMAALIVITFLGCGRIARMLDRDVCGCLGALSMPIYLNQNSFQTIANACFPGWPFWPVTVGLFMALTAFSALISPLFRRWDKRIQK